MTDPTPYTDEQLDNARALVAEVEAGHPQFRDTPDDELMAWQREVKAMWGLNLTSAGFGYVAGLLATVDAERARADALLDTGNHRGAVLSLRQQRDALAQELDAERALRQQAEAERDDLASQLAAIRRRATEHPKGLSTGYVLAVMDTPAAPVSGTPGEDTDTPADKARQIIEDVTTEHARTSRCHGIISSPDANLRCVGLMGHDGFHDWDPTSAERWAEDPVLAEPVCTTCKGTRVKPWEALTPLEQAEWSHPLPHVPCPDCGCYECGGNGGWWEGPLGQRRYVPCPDCRSVGDQPEDTGSQP